MMEFLPFDDPATRRTLAGAMLVALGGAPLGVMMVLRRMSLMGDVIAHAILPGTAAGFIIAGLSVPAMSFGGLLAGVVVALAAGLVSRVTAIREDTNLATFYLLAVAIGVLMLALHGTAQDLESILFGSPESISGDVLIAMAAVTSATLLVLAIIWRPLVVESFDPVFMRSVRGHGGFYHVLFMMLLVLNMVEGYRMIGTMMAAGLMLIPAASAQLWSRRIGAQIGIAALIGVVASPLGVWLALCLEIPSGPAVILFAGAVYLLSLAFGRHGSLRARYFPGRHLES
ncbi:MAG: metal ABC transporter permease [Bdellovibrionales bacterium]